MKNIMLISIIAFILASCSERAQVGKFEISVCSGYIEHPYSISIEGDWSSDLVHIWKRAEINEMPISLQIPGIRDLVKKCYKKFKANEWELRVTDQESVFIRLNGSNDSALNVYGFYYCLGQEDVKLKNKAKAIQSEYEMLMTHFTPYIP